MWKHRTYFAWEERRALQLLGGDTKYAEQPRSVYNALINSIAAAENSVDRAELARLARRLQPLPDPDVLPSAARRWSGEDPLNLNRFLTEKDERAGF